MGKKLFSLALSGVLILTGCGGSIPADTDDDNVHFYSFFCRDCEVGAAYTVNNYHSAVTMFLDYASMETAPLCAVPNCNHQDSDCLAKNAEYPIIFGEDMYFFRSKYGVEETKKGREFRMHSAFRKASLDNSEISTVCEFTDAIPRNDESMIICGHKLFFIAYDPDAEIDDYGGLSVKSGGGHDFLCSVDLVSSEYKNYGSICYVEDEYPAADNSSSAHITGFGDGKIYIGYEFMKEFADPKNGVIPEWTRYSFVFNTETEQYSESSLPAAIFADDELYCWLDDYNDELHIIMNDKEYVVSYDSYTNSAHHLRDKLFVANGRVELSDMSMHYMSDEFRDSSAVASFGEYFILRKSDDSFIRLTEDELLKLEK
ncbi:MAG: hypothetical protein K6G82_02150 [Ruminococcus sp.]|nr:hypothetical protein [Ruminococcus sp.]